MLDTSITEYNRCVVWYADTLQMDVGGYSEKLVALSVGLHDITSQRNLILVILTSPCCQRNILYRHCPLFGYIDARLETGISSL
jgi:hypothetical protein